MYKTSTYFIKGQLPGVTQAKLIGLYKRELEEQSVNTIHVNSDVIRFSNDTFKFVLNRFANKFAGFSKGEIRVADEGEQFGVYLQAELTRTLKFAGLLGCVVAILSVFSNGVNWFDLVLGTAVFVFVAGIGFVSTYVSFPIYFTSLRNDIERELQRG